MTDHTRSDRARSQTLERRRARNLKRNADAYRLTRAGRIVRTDPRPIY